MNTSDAYDPNDRFDLTPAGAEYLATLDACDDGRDEAFTGEEYAGDAYAPAPLDDGAP